MKPHEDRGAAGYRQAEKAGWVSRRFPALISLDKIGLSPMKHEGDTVFSVGAGGPKFYR